jgi:hypothetical protein
MCWMASRRLGSPERVARELSSNGGGNLNYPRLQLADNILPPRSQSVPVGMGLPPLGAAAGDDKNAGRSVQASQSITWAEGHAGNDVSTRVSKTSLQLEVPQALPLKSGGKAKARATSVATSAAGLQHAQAARLPRLAGHLHVPPAALQQAQTQARKGQVY